MVKTTCRGLAALAALAVSGTAAATQATPGLAVPALGPAGWVTLTALLAGAGFVVLRRRPPK